MSFNYTSVGVGGNLMYPITNNATDLGSSSNKYRQFHVTGVNAGVATVTDDVHVGAGVSAVGIVTADQGLRVNADSAQPTGNSVTNYISVGESQDLKVYHNGGTNYIAARDGDIQIRSDTFMLVSDDTAGRAIYLDNSNSLLELGFDGNHAIHVKATGTEFIKDVKVVNGSNVGVASIAVNGNASFAGIVTANGGLKVGSNANTGIAASIFTNGNVIN